MKFTEFRDSIQKELLTHPSGFTWIELRDRLSLPYDRPCQNWINRLEQEIDLVRKEQMRGAYVWKIKPSKE